MPQKSREEEIIAAIREHLVNAVKGLDSITDERLMKAAKCARATFYKYVSKGSAIEEEIELARAEQKRYAESATGREGVPGHDPSMRKRLEEAEAGNRKLLAYVARMSANLAMYGVPSEIIQAAQEAELPHPDRRFNRTGRGRRRR